MLLDGPLEKSDWMPQQNLSSEVNFDLHDVSLESLTNEQCQGCKDFLNSHHIFKCLTCDSHGKMDIQTNYSALYCHLCIFTAHLRSGHEIVDKNGLDPEICTVHTNICIFFCNSCVTTFCSGCIANHFSHNFNWAYRKAKEILTNIHEKRAHFEGLSVHGNHERSVRLECENRITSLHRNLGEENIAEYLTNLFCDVIRSNIHRWSRAVDEKVGSYLSHLEAAETSENQLEEIDSPSNDCLQTLKGLLQMSESCLVTEYIREEKKLERCLKQQKGQTARHQHLKWTVSFETIAINAIEMTLRSIKIPCFVYNKILPVTLTPRNTRVNKNEIFRVDDRYPRKNWKNWYSSDFLDINITDTEVSFMIPNQNDVAFMTTSPKTVMEKFTFRLKNIAKVFKCQDYAVFVNNSNSVLVYCLVKMCKFKKFSLNPKFTLLGMIASPGRNYDQRFKPLVWNSEAKQIEKMHIGSSSNNFAFPCNSKPTLFHNCCDTFVYLHENHDIIIASFDTKVEMRIEKLHLGLQKIDKIRLCCDELYIMDFTSGIIVKSFFCCESAQQQSWEIEKVMKVNKPLVDVGFCSDKTHFIYGRHEGTFYLGSNP